MGVNQMDVRALIGWSIHNRREHPDLYAQALMYDETQRINPGVGGFPPSCPELYVAVVMREAPRCLELGPQYIIQELNKRRSLPMPWAAGLFFDDCAAMHEITAELERPYIWEKPGWNKDAKP